MKIKRGALGEAMVEEKSNIMCRRFAETDIYKSAQMIAFYMPIKNEVNLAMLMNKAFSDGKRVCVPVVNGDDMFFSEITGAEMMKEGRFGIKEPQKRKKTNAADLILVPGLAFDFYGGRVGWGKGYYDRALEGSAAKFVGICYEFQLCGIVETEPQDCRMDYILTESELVVCG